MRETVRSIGRRDKGYTIRSGWTLEILLGA